MNTFKKARTFSDIVNDDRVFDISFEEQSYWIYLKEGYICPHMGCGTIHEPTISRCASLLNSVITTQEYERMLTTKSK